MRTRLQVCIALMLAGVAMGQGKATKLIFYKLDGLFGTTLHSSIKIDGPKAVHKLRNSRYWTTEVTAGEHFIYGDDEHDGRKHLIWRRVRLITSEWKHAVQKVFIPRW